MSATEPLVPICPRLVYTDFSLTLLVPDLFETKYQGKRGLLNSMLSLQRETSPFLDMISIYRGVNVVSSINLNRTSVKTLEMVSNLFAIIHLFVFRLFNKFKLSITW